MINLFRRGTWGICILAAVASYPAGSARGEAPKRVLSASFPEKPSDVTRALTDNPDAIDPQELLRDALRNYRENVRDYSCLFVKREFFKGRHKPKQAIKVLYREEPLSILMTWVDNPQKIRRALYVKGQTRDKNGVECAVVEPQGAIARLFAPKVNIPIHGKRARKAGQHTMDQFGFRSILERVIAVNELADSRGELEIEYAGEGSIDGRPTHKIVRRLPYANNRDDYTDGKLILHIDKEWLVPVAVYNFSDQQGTRFLGSYELLKVEFNQQFDSSYFTMSSR